jgi:hypothetical protein
MLDISNDLVYIMSENDCSSVYALFLLSEENESCSHSTTPTHKETMSGTAS